MCILLLHSATGKSIQLNFNGNPIAIFPDYMATVARGRAAFTPARKMFREKPGVRYGLLYPARFCISNNNEERELVDATKAMDNIRKHILPVGEMED